MISQYGYTTLSSHANLEPGSRALKAEKIRRLIESRADWSDSKVLEIGTGSGHMASYLAKYARSVDSVDVVDERLANGFNFHLVHGTALPFADRSFDIVLSNHVIEHVGDRTDQLMHLQEMRRVTQGLVYLAFPNRWAPIEPHYKLPLLSWMPWQIGSAYVRLFGRGSQYEVRPLGPMAIRKLLQDAGFRWEDITVDALRETLNIEFPHFSTIPVGLLGRLGLLMPSFVFLLARN